MLGVAGEGLTAINTFANDDFFVGNCFRVGLGLVVAFTLYGWVYVAVDIGVGLYTGKSLTDKTSSGIDNIARYKKMRSYLNNIRLYFLQIY